MAERGRDLTEIDDQTTAVDERRRRNAVRARAGVAAGALLVATIGCITASGDGPVGISGGMGSSSPTKAAEQCTLYTTTGGHFDLPRSWAGKATVTFARQSTERHTAKVTDPGTAQHELKSEYDISLANEPADSLGDLVNPTDVNGKDILAKVALNGEDFLANKACVQDNPNDWSVRLPVNVSAH